MPRESFVPYPDQVIADIRAQIADGRLRPGQRLPSTRDLAKQYGYAASTVRKAIERLIADGTLYSHQGAGVFVADPTRPGRGVDGPAPPGAS